MPTPSTNVRRLLPAGRGRDHMRLRRASLWIYGFAVAMTALGALFAFVLPVVAR